MHKFHRLLSLALCLALVLFCLSVPFRSTASASATATIVIGIAGSTVSVAPVIAVVATILVAVGLASGTVDDVVDQATNFYNNCSSSLKKWFDGVASDVIDGTSVFRIPSTVQNELKDELGDKAPNNIPYLLIPGTLTNLASLTGADVFIQDVIGAIESGNSLSEITNNLLRNTYGLLNTGFAELGDLLETQTSSLSADLSEVTTKLTRINENLYTQLTRVNSALGSLSDSVDLMEQSLSGDLVDLKTLYSTFGNQTLSKLDTLNESIQAIDSSSLSTDFLNLYNLIAQNDSLIKKSVEALPGQISDSISSFFETQSLQLEDISNKLGTFEESFLEMMSGDLQLIRDDVSAGFADVTVALDQLELTTDIDLQPLIDKIDEFEFATDNYLSYLSELQGSSFESILSSLENLDLTASVDFQPVIDQIANSATDISTWLDSLYLVQDEYFANLNTTLTDFYNHISELYLDEFTSAISTGVSDLTGSFEDLLNDTSHLVEVDVKLGDLLDGDFLSKEVETLQSLGFVTSESFDSFVESYSYHADLTAGYIDNWGFTLDSALTNLQTELTSSLSEIKTAVQSIAGTTTADPSPGGNNSQDDYEKEKAPLMPWVGSGFEIGGSYFNSIQGFLGDDMDAFLVAGMIFEEFAGMTFFYKLIIISCSVGLIGTLLGMALHLQGYSVAQRRREEAAQSKAHNRMERSYAA